MNAATALRRAARREVTGAHVPWVSLTKPKTYPEGRICLVCSTILSRYTSGEFCSVHEEPRRVAHYARHTTQRLSSKRDRRLFVIATD